MQETQARLAAWAGKTVFRLASQVAVDRISLSRRAGGQQGAGFRVSIHMRIAFVALAAALVAGLGGTVLAGASPSSEPAQITELSWSPDGKWLAYVLDTNRGALGVQILRVVRFDRAVQRNVVTATPTGELSSIKWAPDSKRFAVREYEQSTSSYGTQISSANGRRVRRFPGAFTDWSPNSRDFLVQDESSTYIVNSITRAKRFLVEGGGALWSPSGTRIAFSATTRETTCGNDYRLFSVGPSGAGRLQLGTDRFSFTVQFAAAWAPDSSRVAYYEGTEFECYKDHGVVIVPADGSKQAVELGDWSGAISWSPTGARLATRNLVTSELRIVTPDGATQATIPSVQEYGWAPSGARVVFKSIESPGDEAGPISVSRIDGSASHVIAELGDHPAWSKLGWIAYSNGGSCKAGGDRVFVVRPNGKHRHALSRCRPTR
jgi:dipeptidyl aminopeptidase/acylaminoacyl peptidase